MHHVTRVNDSWKADNKCCSIDTRARTSLVVLFVLRNFIVWIRRPHMILSTRKSSPRLRNSCYVSFKQRVLNVNAVHGFTVCLMQRLHARVIGTLPHLSLLRNIFHLVHDSRFFRPVVILFPKVMLFFFFFYLDGL